MKNILIVAGLLAIATVPLSCTKETDNLRTAEPAAARRVKCNLTEFAFMRPYSAGPDTLRFTYNSKGDPVSGIRPVVTTGYPNLEFRYKNGQLSDLLFVYSNGSSGELWHRYQYDKKGRIYLDSIYTFPVELGAYPTVYYDSYCIRLAYDNQGRIIKETYEYSGNPSGETTYSYDANGNLAGGSYDNKVNFRQTNPIWQFLDRDYSVNNRAVYTAYNSNGLPLSTQPASGDNIIGHFLYDGDFTEATLVYDCRGTK